MKRAFLSLLLLCFLIVLLLPSAASAQSVPNWAPNTAYAVGALVMYNGVEYECIQAHRPKWGGSLRMFLLFGNRSAMVWRPPASGPSTATHPPETGPAP